MSSVWFLVCGLSCLSQSPWSPSVALFVAVSIESSMLRPFQGHSIPSAVRGSFQDSRMARTLARGDGECELGGTRCQDPQRSTSRPEVRLVML